MSIENIIYLQPTTLAATSNSFQLSNNNLTITVAGLQGSEAAPLQTLDPISGNWNDYYIDSTLQKFTSSITQISLSNTSGTFRVNKPTTVNAVGVVISEFVLNKQIINNALNGQYPGAISLEVSSNGSIVTTNPSSFNSTTGKLTAYLTAPGGIGSGATSLIISSPDSSIEQTSQSYNSITQTLSLGLKTNSRQSTFIIQTGTSQTLAALLAAQIPPVTDAVGNFYIVTNTSNDYINLTTSSTGSFVGFGGFADCSSTTLVIPPLGVAVFITLLVGAGNANTYQITGISNNSNINVLGVFAGGNIASIFTTANVIDKVQNMYQILNTNSNAITITGGFTNFASWANCTATTMQIPANGSALILTTEANTTYSIILTSAGLSLPTTPMFNSVNITDASNALSIGENLSQSIFTTLATTNRTVTLPDGDSITVQPNTVADGNAVAGIAPITGELIPVTLPVVPNASIGFNPADNSGSVVTITNNGSFYNFIGTTVFANVNVTYGSNADSSNASILLAGLPNCNNLELRFVIFTDFPTIFYSGAIAAETNIISIYDIGSGNPIINSDLSGQTLIISQLIYATA